MNYILVAVLLCYAEMVVVKSAMMMVPDEVKDAAVILYIVVCTSW